MKKIFLAIAFVIGVVLFANAQNAISLQLKEMKDPLTFRAKSIKVLKFGDFLKINASGELMTGNSFYPVDLILALPKYDYTSGRKKVYKNDTKHSVNPREDASFTIKIGDDSYGTFYRCQPEEGRNSQAFTTDYEIVATNEGANIKIDILPGTILNTSENTKPLSETKKVTFSNTKQVFIVANPSL